MTKVNTFLFSITCGVIVSQLFLLISAQSENWGKIDPEESNQGTVRFRRGGVGSFGGSPGNYGGGQSSFGRQGEQPGGHDFGGGFNMKELEAKAEAEVEERIRKMFSDGEGIYPGGGMDLPTGSNNGGESGGRPIGGINGGEGRAVFPPKPKPRPEVEVFHPRGYGMTGK